VFGVTGAAGPSVDLEASVSQQFPNDQMRVQLVKESRGKSIETLQAEQRAAQTAQ